MTSWRYRDSRWTERLTAPINWNSKIAPLAVLAAILVIVGASVVIARGDSAELIAHDASVMSSSQLVVSGAAALNAEVREGLLVAQGASAGVFDGEAPTAAASRIRQAVTELAQHADSLVEATGEGGIGETASMVTDHSASVATALENGDSDRALTTAEEHLTPALEQLTSQARTIGDESANEIRALSAGLGTVTTAARFVAAMLIPALAVFLLYRALRKSQKVSLLRTELAREQELRHKKDAFVAAASRHVKDPLSAVIGFAELLRDSSDDFSVGTQQELTRLIAAEAGSTVHVVDDLFAAAGYELGDFQLDEDRVELRDVLDAVTASWEYRQKLTISGNALVSGDERWLGHAIRNVLRAAVSSGGEQVDVTMNSDDDRVTVEISDDGAAISTDENERITDLYYSSGEIDGLAPSLGLGLSVARRIAKSSGGDIRYRRQQGRNVYGLTLPVLHSPVLPRSRLIQIIDPAAGKPGASSVEAAISDGTQMDFQPIMELSPNLSGNGRVVGYEALARFASHSPEDWFEAAGSMGLQGDLELACIKSAIEGFKSDDNKIFLSVNISDQTLHSPRFGDVTAEIDPTRLVLELTDTAPIASYEETRATLEGLSDSGVRIAVDIGTDRLDLRHLSQLSASILKIGPSITMGMDRSPMHRALIRGLTALADELGAIVVAVGVETEDQHDLLFDLGVRYGQGHLYASRLVHERDKLTRKTG